MRENRKKMKIPKNNKNTIKILEEFQKEKELKEIAIGKILGDGSITDTGNLNFCHSSKQKEYIEHCYELFKKFTKSGIKEYQNKRKDKIHKVLVFETKAIFKKELSIFYKYEEKNKKRIKLIPTFIEELITPISLAYRIMDDGYYDKPNIKLCTHSFTLEEVNLLKNVLQSKFKLNCKISKIKVRDTGLFWYLLIIKKDSLNLLWEMLSEHIIPSMRYKFGK